MKNVLENYISQETLLRFMLPETTTMIRTAAKTNLSIHKDSNESGNKKNQLMMVSTHACAHKRNKR